MTGYGRGRGGGGGGERRIRVAVNNNKCGALPRRNRCCCYGFIFTHLDSSKGTTVKNGLEYNRVRVSAVRVHARARQTTSDNNITNIFAYIGNYYYYYLCCSRRLRTVERCGKTIFNNKFVRESQGTRNNLRVRPKICGFFRAKKIYRRMCGRIKRKLSKNTLAPQNVLARCYRRRATTTTGTELFLARVLFPAYRHDND